MSMQDLIGNSSFTRIETKTCIKIFGANSQGNSPRRTARQNGEEVLKLTL